MQVKHVLCSPQRPCKETIELLSSVLDLDEESITYTDTVDDTVRSVSGIGKSAVCFVVFTELLRSYIICFACAADITDEAASNPTMSVATMKPSQALDFLNVDKQLQKEVDSLWSKARQAWKELKEMELKAEELGEGGGTILVVGGEDALSAMMAVEIGLEPTAKNASAFRLRTVRTMRGTMAFL